MFEKHQLTTFKELYPEPPTFKLDDKAEGRPYAWFNEVSAKAHGLSCPELPKEINRAQLLASCADEKNDMASLCVSILAWGNMNRANRDRLFSQEAKLWCDIADKIRSEKPTRAEAYEAFARKRAEKSKPMAGLGPAYFTKLIYFLTAGHGKPGYIMDQWAGLSVNLITGSDSVKMDHTITWRRAKGESKQTASSRVSDLNTGEDYERFCSTLEDLSEELGPLWTPGQTERALMSNGGRKGHPWRQHVVKERFGSVVTIKEWL